MPVVFIEAPPGIRGLVNRILIGSAEQLRPAGINPLAEGLRRCRTPTR